jgi:hypothetical protein
MKVIRALVQPAPYWQSEAKRLSRHGYSGKRPDLAQGSAAEACRQAAATARLWGLPVGVVTTVEVQSHGTQ